MAHLIFFWQLHQKMKMNHGNLSVIILLAAGSNLFSSIFSYRQTEVDIFYRHIFWVLHCMRNFIRMALGILALMCTMRLSMAKIRGSIHGF